MTNQFTDEQVLAAAIVLDRNAFRDDEAESKAWEVGGDFRSELSAMKQRIRTRKYRAKKKARDALEAAAGVAPQAPSDDSPTPGNHAQVQPSSTVDEGNVRQQVASGLVSAGIKPHDPAYYTAIDAVVEAIGGESRG